MHFLARSSVLGTRLVTVLKDIAPPADVVFTVRGHPEQLVVRAGMPGSVLVRSPRQRRGEYLDWAASSYRRLDPEKVLDEVGSRVVRVQVPGVERPFGDLASFLRWVEAQPTPDPRHSYLIKLPATVFEALRVKAKERGTTVRELIVEAVRRSL